MLSLTLVPYFLLQNLDSFTKVKKVDNLEYCADMWQYN